tara:strand:+ start:956 stop:1246 length:291 start_codon:yes stop_codon:yes gene_type:complete
MRHLEYMRMKAEQAREQSDHKEIMDMVNSPSHYNEFGIECIDAIQAATGSEFKSYLQGNIMKYLWRYRYKGKPVEDLQKAEWYLSRLIDTVKDEEV